mmetsp:Transcript_38325/g.60709  ORF Transcript_38325/g.60709 Transcript_38325/m.60709 type:complete len:122 (-) Transcript_38325:1797-2162(-)
MKDCVAAGSERGRVSRAAGLRTELREGGGETEGREGREEEEVGGLHGCELDEGIGGDWEAGPPDPEESTERKEEEDMACGGKGEEELVEGSGVELDGGTRPPEGEGGGEGVEGEGGGEVEE